MILSSVIDDLSDDELSMLLYVLNVKQPGSITIDLNNIKSFRIPKLQEKLIACKDDIKIKHIDLYISLCGHFNIKVNKRDK